jgi:hypothetical protein
VTDSLKKRYFGYELSGIEYRLIFEKDDMGYVRFKNKRENSFYLDPSPFLDTQKPDVYVIKAGDLPPAGQLIEVVVTETSTSMR